jgi:hypothetical protein
MGSELPPSVALQAVASQKPIPEASVAVAARFHSVQKLPHGERVLLAKSR